MGQMKNYLINLIANCSEHKFGQDAVEWFIFTGQIKLSYDLETDLRTIMGEPGFPETGIYDRICEEYHNFCRRVEVQGNIVSPEQEEVYHASHLIRTND